MIADRRDNWPFVLLLLAACYLAGRSPQLPDVRQLDARQRAQFIPAQVLPWVPDFEVMEPIDAPSAEGDDAASSVDAPPVDESPELDSGGAAPSAPPLPFSVRISGPVDSLVGDLVELSAEVTSDATQFAWSIDPPVRGLLILDGGAKAVFSNRTAGQYLVIVSAANHDGQTAHATLPFNLRPAPPENPLTVESLTDAAPAPNVENLIRRWSAEVVTDNRAGETAAVAGSFRGVGNLLLSGNLMQGPDADPLYEVEKVAEQNLGPAAFSKWESFFKRVRDFLYPLSVKNHLVTPDQYGNTFLNLAAELEEIAAGR